MTSLSLLFGGMVGLCMGMTGGGGAIFAVPMLVYGLAVAPRNAIGISLAAVGATAFLGFLMRWYLREAAIRTGFLFAFTGMLFTPMGTWIGNQTPEALLMVLFAGLMLLVAWRMWRQANRSGAVPASAKPDQGEPESETMIADAKTSLKSGHSIQQVGVLLALGAVTGLLSGLFGVGGGFIIVPALVLIMKMEIHRAIGTSLMIISLISVSGVASSLWSGRSLDAGLTIGFIIGGVGGMLLGLWISRLLSGPTLQKIFAVVILLVASFVLLSHLMGWVPDAKKQPAPISQATMVKPHHLETAAAWRGRECVSLSTMMAWTNPGMTHPHRRDPRTRSNPFPRCLAFT